MTGQKSGKDNKAGEQPKSLTTFEKAARSGRQEARGPGPDRDAGDRVAT